MRDRRKPSTWPDPTKLGRAKVPPSDDEAFFTYTGLDSRSGNLVKAFGNLTIAILCDVAKALPPLADVRSDVALILSDIADTTDNRTRMRSLWHHVAVVKDSLSLPYKHQERCERLRSQLSTTRNALSEVKQDGHLQFSPGGRSSRIALIEEYISQVDHDLVEYKVSYENHRKEFRSAQLNALDKIPRAYQAEYGATCERRPCLKETRIELLRRLDLWARDVDSPPLCWLSGDAGSGKSAIAETFAAIQFTEGQLGASFFCSRDSRERSCLEMIFPTIAHQLARGESTAASRFRTALLRTTSTVTAEQGSTMSCSLSEQLNMFLIEPARESNIRSLVIIDALDACWDSEITSRFLTTLADRISELSNIKFFITSRPEPRIQQGFDLHSINSVTEVMLLHDMKASSSSHGDIKLFLRHELNGVYGSIDISDEWPKEEDIDRLTAKVAGHFSFAVTAVQFIKREDHNPQDQLLRLLRYPVHWSDSLLMRLTCTEMSLSDLASFIQDQPEVYAMCMGACMILKCVMEEIQKIGPTLDDESINLIKALQSFVAYAATHNDFNMILGPRNIIAEIAALTIQCAAILDLRIRALDSTIRYSGSRIHEYIQRLKVLHFMLLHTKCHPVIMIEIIGLKIERFQCDTDTFVRITVISNDGLSSQSATLRLHTTLTWDPTLCVPCQLVLRPSSLLMIEVIDSNDSNKTLLTTLVPFASLIASANGRNRCVYQSFDSDGILLAEFHITLGILYNTTGDPKSCVPTEPRKQFDSTGSSEEDSHPTGITLAESLVAFLHKYDADVPPVPYTFLLSTIPTLSKADLPVPVMLPWCDYSGPHIQDLISQLSRTLQLLTCPGATSPVAQGLVLKEVLSELCECVAMIEEGIGGHSESRDNGVKFINAQERLFTSLYRAMLHLHGETKHIPQSGTLDIASVVQHLLLLSRKENSQPILHRDEPFSPGRRLRHPFAAALASAFGVLSERIFVIIDKLLHRTSEVVSRDLHRRALVRLVQCADRLPRSFWVHVDLPNRVIQACGSFARVYRGKMKNGDAVIDVAIKAPHVLSTLPHSVKLDERRALYIEIVSWKTVRHPRLLPFLGLAVLPDIGHLCMVSPFMKKGTLKSGCDATSSVHTRLRYIKEVVEGMVYLHDEGLVHGDLRAVNIFINDDGGIQIADFGLSVLSEGFSKNYGSRRAGNVRWKAPELLAPHLYLPYEFDIMDLSDNPNPELSTRPTKPSDVYTFSCLCIELFTGQPPYPKLDDGLVGVMVPRPKKMRPPRPSRMSDNFWQLLQKCWDDEATLRPTFREIDEELKDGGYE